MQNRYAGDVGDFGKLGLLRQIAASGFFIGVNWYLVPDESHNNDGKHIGYLTDRQYDGCDDALRKSLKELVINQRSIHALEEQRLIADASYYSDILYSPSVSFFRQNWHENALKKLKGADIVFLDPDNGLLVKSVSTCSKKSNKYVLQSEIADYYVNGKSVIFYNHRCREKEEEYLQRFEWLQDDPSFESANLVFLKFIRGTVRDYIFVLQPDHAIKIKKCINNMLLTPWERHFKRIELSD